MAPIVTPAMTVTLLPMAARVFTRVSITVQSLSVCNVPSALTALDIGR